MTTGNPLERKALQGSTPPLPTAGDTSGSPMPPTPLADEDSALLRMARSALPSDDHSSRVYREKLTETMRTLGVEEAKISEVLAEVLGGPGSDDLEH